MDDLTDEQHAHLEAALRTLQTELTQLIADDSETSTVDLEQPIGRISRVDALQSQKMAEARKRRHRHRLKLVAAALKRVASGDFGYCADCGENIGYGRLSARPETPFCVPCQTERERP